MVLLMVYNLVDKMVATKVDWWAGLMDFVLVERMADLKDLP